MTNEKKIELARATKQRFVQAAVITLLFHGLLMILFTSTKKSNQTFVEQENKLTMLSFKSNYINNDEILKLIEYNDPTLIPKPNEKYGYSRIHRKRKPVLLESDLVYNNKKLEEWRVSKYKKLENREAEPGVLKDSWDYYSLPVLNKHTNANFVLEYPLWIDENGNPIQQLLTSTQLNSIKELLRKSPVTATVFEIKFQKSSLPNIKIVESCGDRKLDLLALRQLAKKSSHMECVDKNGKTDIKIYWRKD